MVPLGLFGLPTHGNLADYMYVLDIQGLLLMEILNPREHSFQKQMEFPFREILAPISSEQSQVTGRTWEGLMKRVVGVAGQGSAGKGEDAPG